MISAIVAVDANWGIGYNGQLLEHISDDLKRFKELTSNNTVVMGRKTWESLPNKPLPNRFNIVLTSTPSQMEQTVNTKFLTMNDFLMNLNSLEEFMDEYGKEIFIIGGGQIYHSLLSIYDRVYVTKIYKSHENVDSYFPNLDNDNNWKMVSASEIFTNNNLTYQFCCYDRVS